jgi:Lon protease-like protein
MRLQRFWAVLSVSLILGYGFTSGFCLQNLGDNRIRVPALTAAAAGATDANVDDPRGDRSLILPIFPLRKAVRLPTETLTLNLYEERYLAMSEFVLKSDQRLFGALFSSDKPQVVKGGMGKIVPMIQPGDIGVVFVLEDSEDGLVQRQGAPPRRQIRLVGTGAGRFQIQKILHNGYGDDSLPFIVVEAILLNDNHSASVSDEDRLNLERNLWDKAIKMNTDKKSSSSSNRNNDEKSRDLVEGLVAKLHRTTLTEQTREEMKAELSSFALASALISDSSSKDRLEMLRMCSARSRLSVLDASVRKVWSLGRA